MQKVSGRSDDMYNQGSQCISLWWKAYCWIYLELNLIISWWDRKGTLDILVRVEVSEQVFSDEVRKLEELGATISKELESALGISAKVRLVEPKSIERSEGKAQRVIDRRSI